MDYLSLPITHCLTLRPFRYNNLSRFLQTGAASSGSLGIRNSSQVQSYGHGLAPGNAASRSVISALVVDPQTEIISDLSGGGASIIDYMPMSPSSSGRGVNGSVAGLVGTPMASRVTLPSYAQNAGMQVGSGSVGVMPPRLRMAAMVPPVNVGSVQLSAASGRLMHSPAPPMSPKPHTPEMSNAFHRPASGVLSDDSFLPPSRAPSISLGAQLLSPLQVRRADGYL